MRTVHPHVRGEMRVGSPRTRWLYGSSPRAWGNGLDAEVCEVHLRFIPTCVGKCLGLPEIIPDCPVHPHVRGEMCDGHLDILTEDGSSPRAWGNGPTRRAGGCRPRFIPTCVGKCPGCRSSRGKRPVHPHVRGEMALRVEREGADRGSSPRAWGDVPDAVRREENVRFIPTCVGKCYLDERWPGCPSVHPHVRGEMRHIQDQDRPKHGSSPRAWGNGTSGVERLQAFRFIPTCVGKWPGRRTRRPRRTVHPHVRGEMFNYPRL